MLEDGCHARIVACQTGQLVLRQERERSHLLPSREQALAPAPLRRSQSPRSSSSVRTGLVQPVCYGSLARRLPRELVGARDRGMQFANLHGCVWHQERLAVERRVNRVGQARLVGEELKAYL